MSSSLESLLTVIISAVGVVVWLVRLEGKAMESLRRNAETQNEVDDLRLRLESLDERLMRRLSAIERSLARIEGRLSVEPEEE